MGMRQVAHLRCDAGATTLVSAEDSPPALLSALQQLEKMLFVLRDKRLHLVLGKEIGAVVPVDLELFVALFNNNDIEFRFKHREVLRTYMLPWSSFRPMPGSECVIWVDLACIIKRLRQCIRRERPKVAGTMIKAGQSKLHAALWQTDC